MYCCNKCFNKNKISKYIKEHGIKRKLKCDFCGSKNNIISIKPYELKNFLLEIIFKKYEFVDDGSGCMYDSEEKIYIDGDGNEAEPISIYDILIDENDILSFDDDKKVEKLLYNIFYPDYKEVNIKPDEFDLEDFFDPYLDFFVLKDDLHRMYGTTEYISWDSFVYITKYYNRFFDINSNKTKLLKNLKHILKKMEELIRESTIFYRARDYSNDIYNMSDKDFYKELSPPPNKFSKNSRMSPAGISYMYLNNDIKACISEIKSDSNKFLIGKFTNKKELKIINLSKRIKFETDIFSDDYKSIWINEFIKEFSKEISKKISEKDNIIDYIPTQVLSEFIRKIGYDGLKFESSIVRKTFNYTLFCGPEQNLFKTIDEIPYIDYRFPDNYPTLPNFTEWLELKEVQYYKNDNIMLNKHINNITSKNISQYPQRL